MIATLPTSKAYSIKSEKIRFQHARSEELEVNEHLVRSLLSERTRAFYLDREYGYIYYNLGGYYFRQNKTLVSL